MAIGAVLVIGAGIGGMKCSLDLAESGFKVCLSDRSPWIGGTLAQLDKWFPDNHCGMCKILPIFSRDESSQFCLRRGLFHPNIELLPLSRLQKVEGEAGSFAVTLGLDPRGVREELCIGCDLCAQACPVEAPDEFNEGLGKRKAIYRRNPLTMPNSYAIDWESCTRCGQCVQRCPTSAIDLSPQQEARELEVGAIILATGFEEMDPRPLTQYGYKRYPNVITSIELERMLSPAGPFAGRLVRPSDGEPPHSVAFLQCVGSRDQERNYCSSACCMYALKEAMLVKEAYPDTDVRIFFMDLRAFGKGYHRYYQRAEQDLGIGFSRCRIPSLKQDPKTKNLLFTAKGEKGLERLDFDLVVLSVGQAAPPRFHELSQTLGIELNRWGFCRTEEFSPVETSRAGIYVCGSASAPKDIADTLIEAGAAACQASMLLSPQRNQEVHKKSYPQERDVSAEEPRTAIFLCRCGEEIASAVDMAEMANLARRLLSVIQVEEVPFLCLGDNLDEVKGRIKEIGANRLVIGACSAFSRLFVEATRGTGLNPSLLGVVDLRQQLSSIPGRREAATVKGKSLLAIAVERVRGQQPLPLSGQGVERQALIIGGGLCGLVAALSLAEQGFDAHLVERSSELGGNLKDIYATLEGSDPQGLLKELVKRAEESPLIHLYKEAEVMEASGYAGNFVVTLRGSDSVLHHLKVGAIVVATGAQEHRPTEYLYGESEQVITQRELEGRLARGELDPQELSSVVMIQCVGSRDRERPYCSRICCSQALKNALSLKEKNPAVDILVLYRDVMSYGFREEYYTRAREKGVLFINYDVDHKPEVRAKGKALEVQVIDPVLGGTLSLEPDLVVLSPALVPHDNRRLAEMLGVELTEDGFFREAEAKFRPVDFLADGIFLCGLAHSPRGIGESIAQAQAAAQRAASILSRRRLESGRVVSEVKERRCSGCELCISVCPYGARMKDEETGVVVVREALCQGCGACAAACPNDAAKLRGLSDSQVFSMVDAAL